MAQQQSNRHNKYFTKAPDHAKLHKIKPKDKEVKVLNTEPRELNDTDLDTLILNVLTAANAFKSALKKLKIYDCENEVQKKSVIKVLSDMRNMINMKILSVKKDHGNKTKEKSSKTSNRLGSAHSSVHSLLSLLSESPSKMAFSPESTRNNSSDEETEAFSASKLMSLPKLSLSSAKSSQDNHSVDGGDDVDDVDEKFKEFLENVNCPFCLKREDNKNSLVKHLDRVCTSFKNKIFAKSPDCPYSFFQILPNNTFKCNICPHSVQTNLKKYFAHLQSETHILNCNKAASFKNYTDSLFCSACKIQVPNNGTHILFHLEHKVHERNRNDQHSTVFYRQRGIDCIYGKDKKFKCLICPPGRAIHKSVKEILRHLESEAHLNTLSQRRRSQRISIMYCMFCLIEVNGFNVIGHLNSSGHIFKEEEEEKNEFEMCFYCGFKCSNLHALALHTENCPALDQIRQEDSHQKCEKVDKVLTQIEKSQERPTKESTSEKGRCIVVKDYHKILELYNYFKRFGEVSGIERFGENAIVIKFQEEKTVDVILESQRPIEINGVKLNITRKEDPESSNEVLESSRTAGSTDSRSAGSNDGSDPSLANRNVAGISNSTVDEDFSKITMDGGTLESLFNRVSSHLSYSSVKPDCEDFLNIARDCEQILKLGKCHSTGFLKCGLSFSVEKFTLYCELSDNFIKEQYSDHSSTSLTESRLFNENMCRKCAELLKNSEGVSRVSLREDSFPFVEFYHNKTQKLCSITFRQSENILADELRNCLMDNNKLRSFVLIIRFWLSVHKLAIREFESVIISLLLFFLLRSGVVKTSSLNLRRRPAHEVLNESDTLLDKGCVGNEQNVGKCTTKPKENSVMELFQKFLLFLNQLDIENTAICLPLLYPVPKTKLSQERLMKYIYAWRNPKPPIIIMDPFLFNNLAEDLNKTDWDSLLKTVRETIEYYSIR